MVREGSDGIQISEAVWLGIQVLGSQNQEKGGWVRLRSMFGGQGGV